MSNDKMYDEILRYITEKGETGVNVLAKELDVPLSTMQRYLERQTYFRKTVNRRWDLPDNVDADIKSNTMTLMVTSVENALLLLNSQLAEIQSSVQNALMPVNTLKRGIDSLITPVATKSVNNHSSITKLYEETSTLISAIKKKVSDIPEEYRDLLVNTDWIELNLDLGRTYCTKNINPEIVELILQNTDRLSDEVIKFLEGCQK